MMKASLVPELYVSDLAGSLTFYRDLLGFDLLYERPQERFVYLARGGAEVMLEEPVGRTWLSGPLERPYGRGVNFQIVVDGVDDLHARCAAAGAAIFLAPETKRYARADDTVSVRQFIVEDPDGYLLRFTQQIG